MELAGPYCWRCHGVLRKRFVAEVNCRPHGARDHDLLPSHPFCPLCLGCGEGQLEKLSHDCFNYDEGSDYYGWHVRMPEDMQELEQDLRACRMATWPDFDCETHRSRRESSKALACKDWVGAVLPQWADEARIKPYIHSTRLQHTSAGLPVLVAVDGQK